MYYIHSYSIKHKSIKKVKKKNQIYILKKIHKKDLKDNRKKISPTFSFIVFKAPLYKMGFKYVKTRQ